MPGNAPRNNVLPATYSPSPSSPRGNTRRKGKGREVGEAGQVKTVGMEASCLSFPREAPHSSPHCTSSPGIRVAGNEIIHLEEHSWQEVEAAPHVMSGGKGRKEGRRWRGREGQRQPRARPMMEQTGHGWAGHAPPPVRRPIVAVYYLWSGHCQKYGVCANVSPKMGTKACLQCIVCPPPARPACRGRDDPARRTFGLGMARESQTGTRATARRNRGH